VAVAELLSGVGAEVFVTAVVVDADWSPRVPLDEAGWHAIFGGLARVDKLCEDVGLTQVVHPHVGTLVETADDVGRVLAGSDVRWCLDTGHLAVGGADPFAFARDHVDRIGHVHLKDVRLDVARSLRAGELSLKDATERGLFCPLGQGDVPVADIVSQLEAAGYPGWYVLEQDTAIAGGDPAPGHGPVDDVRASIEFLRTALATGLHPLTDANDLDKTRQGGTDT
jgi:inosose dehydratase